jgi:NAD(P)-dependent dehydrogenase (short-subunit alcohol dehydrogenase family)
MLTSMNDPVVVIVGGTSGVGREIAKAYAARGRDVWITGRDADRGAEVAGTTEGPGGVRSCVLDLSSPLSIADSLREVGPVDRLVLAAGEYDNNTAREYDVARAIRMLTMKLVGYTEVVHALSDRLVPQSSIVLFGGLSARRPQPGLAAGATANGGVTSLVRYLAMELAPIRVNALHPGIVRDSPHWHDKPDSALDRVLERTPLGRLVTMADIVDACLFLLENGAVNGANLEIDGGWLIR